MSNGVALLTPFFNAKRFVERFRDQMSRLSKPFDEVLLLDDGSVDDTADVLKRYGHAVLTATKNSGPGGARNVLAARSSSEWIHFHDIDDEIAPEYLSEVIPYLTDDVDVLMHYVAFIDEKTRAPIINFRYRDDLEHDPVSALLCSPMGTTSSVIRREFFLNIGGFDEKLRCFEDGDMHLRLAIAGARFKGLPKFLETSLRHEGGASANMHYCNKCRLEFLTNYIGLLPKEYMPELAGEFRKTAYGLLSFGDRQGAQRAIDLCRQIGDQFPQSNSFFLRLIGRILPDLWTLSLQEGFRKTASRLQA